MSSAPSVPRGSRRQTTERTLLDVARRLFLERGFDAVTLRGIAADAGVDPSLAVHHFGSKMELFLAALAHDAPANGYFHSPLTAERVDLGIEIAEHVFDESPAGRSTVRLHAAVTTASGRRVVRELVQTMQDDFVITPLIDALGDDSHAAVRARLIAATLAGALDYRAGLGDGEPLPDRAMLVRAYGAAIQAIIDVPLAS